MSVRVSGGAPPQKPEFKRMMVFIDGENLVFNFQKFKDNWGVYDDILHKKDVYVWRESSLDDLKQIEVIRAFYYTYMVGNDEMYSNIIEEIKSLEFNQNSLSIIPNNIMPCVFKKLKKEKNTKGVDIKMTVDILTNIYHDNLDIVYLMSGDGDYVPIIEEAQRWGKLVYLAAFSNGLNKKLKNIVDKFIDLDKIYFY